MNKLLIVLAEALMKTACPHEQWYISKDTKHVTHESTCTLDKTCLTPCPRCAALEEYIEWRRSNG
jgi:NAD-dependent dihydropyrimidine dehydrogenase PreA subunit